MRAWVLMLAMATGSDAAQDKKAPVEAPPKVDPAKVDEAVRKGVQYLKGATVGPATELMLWTYLHAGESESDATFQQLFKAMIAREPSTTYTTSLRAMILEELDRVKYQEEIWKCAQFLIDNMDQNGQWGYGQPTTYAAPVPTAAPKRKDVATKPAPKPKATGKKASQPAERVKPPVVRYLSVKKQRDGTPHDNSNTQYAALGLRACHDAGIVLPEDVIKKAAECWREQQSTHPNDKDDQAQNGGAKRVETPGSTSPPAGWGYSVNGGGVQSGSMTVGGVGSLVIYDYILGQDWKRDEHVLKGLSWTAKHFSVVCNPTPYDANNAKPNKISHYYYYLYGMERAGILYGAEWFGTHAWYAEGARELLQDQQATGSWGNGTIDTCFAILFLRRATRPIQDVASVDRFVPR